MIRTRFAGVTTLMALSLSLSACGGGGTNSTPTPTPSPTPTPVSYTKIADLTAPTTFQTAGVHWQASSSGVSGQGADAFGSGVVVVFDPAAGSYQITTPTGITGTFSGADTDALNTSGNVHSYIKTTASGQQRLRVTLPTVGGVPLSYLIFGTFLDGSGGISRSWSAVGGSPTVASDMPKTGSATYAAETTANVLSGGAVYTTTSASTASFSANFGSGTVSTSVHLLGSPSGSTTVTDFGSFSGTGTISSTGPGFSGTFTGTTGAGFSGAFFGPQATEMGYLFNFANGSIEAFGGVAGKKN